MNSGVQGLAWHTAGGMVRFRSDSSRIAVQVELRAPGNMNHMPRSGSSGFDLYVGQGTAKRFRKTAIPGAGAKEYSALLFTGEAGTMREFTLNFPLYNGGSLCACGVGARRDCGGPDAVRGGTADPVLRLLDHPGRMRLASRQCLYAHSRPLVRCQSGEPRI